MYFLKGTGHENPRLKIGDGGNFQDGSNSHLFQRGKVSISAKFHAFITFCTIHTKTCFYLLHYCFQGVQQHIFTVSQGHSIHSSNMSKPKPRLYTNNGLNVDQIIHFDRSVMTHKIINKQCPESLWDKYTQRNEISRYNTRNNRDLDIPKFKLECTKRGFHLSGLKAWNEIPIEIRETPSLCQFKRKLKTHLKSSANP